MQFVYDISCGNDILEIVDDNYNYIVKARRHKIGDEIFFRNLRNNLIYLYKLNFIEKKKAMLNLISSEEKVIENSKKLHLAWCIVDSKTIEKNIASLNEMGVDKITFVYSDFSQKNFKINFDKLQKILINSSTQCGRSSIIKLELSNSLDDFLKENEDCYMLDFSSVNVSDKSNEIKTLIIGPEGGFSKKDREKFKENFIVGFDTNLILKSETAIISAGSKILL